MTAGLETFAKVRALHDRTDNAGERAAAASRMEKLAHKAGMSVSEALSKLDTPAQKSQAQAAADAFNDFFNTPEMRARRAERERVRQARCVELTDEYGTEAQAFEDTPREAALKAACEPLIVWDARPQWSGHYTLVVWGELAGKAQMPASVRAAVSAGWPIPETVSVAWAEFDAAEKLDSDRAVFEPAYTPHRWVEARRYVLEELCNTMPARSLNDIRARLSWMEYLNGLQMAQDLEEEAVRLATLRADIERMAVQLRQDRTWAGNSADLGVEPADQADPLSSPDPVNATAVQDGQEGVAFHHPLRRTNADKRRDLLALLDSGLSDREIARRVGVSPSTIGNVRRRANAA